MKKTILLFVVTFSLVSCNKKKADISQFSWLIGKWQGDYNGMQTFEEWQPLKDNVMLGRGGVLSDKDTMFSEKVKLDLRGDDLFYVATVPGNPGPVDFKFTHYEKDTAVFENPEHDFPQRILYIHTADGSLYAKIDGQKNKKYSKEEFHFKKVY